MKESEPKRFVVNFQELPTGFPTHKHLSEFWEALGRTVATFEIPQLGGVVFGEIGAQEIAPLAPARPSQPIAVEVVGKGDALRRYRDDDQAPRGWGMGSGGMTSWSGRLLGGSRESCDPQNVDFFLAIKIEESGSQ